MLQSAKDWTEKKTRLRPIFFALVAVCSSRPRREGEKYAHFYLRVTIARFERLGKRRRPRQRGSRRIEAREERGKNTHIRRGTMKHGGYQEIVEFYRRHLFFRCLMQKTAKKQTEYIRIARKKHLLFLPRRIRDKLYFFPLLNHAQDPNQLNEKK